MPVHYEVQEHVATIRLDRPEALNSINREMNEQLARTWARFRDDEDAWVAILTGTGDRAFCAGADLIDLIPEAGEREIALACDFRIAVPRARFGVPEVRWAIIPGGGGTQRLPRLLGVARAMDLILTGRQMEAEEALRVGLINRVVEPEELLPATRELAGQLLQNGPLALRAAKQAVIEGWDRPLAE